MGNAVYGDKMTCYSTIEACSQGCGRYECSFVDKCNGDSALNYVCLPFDMRFFMWLLVGIFLAVVLICSSIVVCFAIRAVRASLQNAIRTDGDVVLYNAHHSHSIPNTYGGYGRQNDAYGYKR